MPQFWMISNRNVQSKGLGNDLAGLSYWAADAGPLDEFSNWRGVQPEQFRKLLTGVAGRFPLILDAARNEEQQHVTIFVHGYNVSWKDAAKRYESLCGHLYSGADSLGLCVLFSWPSDGLPSNYLPDREDARRAADGLADVLSELYDWLEDKQVAATEDQARCCRAKTSMITHSMGNYLMQKAMQHAWTRKNQPLLMSLINQLIMVAADVDNDLFNGGERIDKSDGDAIANLCYRITNLYSGRDSVLGMSAGLKHFGKRRLGRSGLDDPEAVPDNVWQVDCSDHFPPGTKNIHSAYFDTPETLTLMRRILRGVDRGVIAEESEASAQTV